ncbi:MAG: YtxH domain-containing protein [Chloroflexi bacterium]|nr:YtxH domain-containing protein [Chloroflexota bacterium]
MKNLFAFVAGISLGAVAAMLLAPETGEELRKQLQDQAARNKSALQDAWQRDLQELNERISNMQATMQEDMNSVSDTVDEPSTETGDEAAEA